MTLKPCVECNHVVSDRGKTCPSCGAPAPRPWSQAFAGFVVSTFWLTLFGVFLYAAFIG